MPSEKNSTLVLLICLFCSGCSSQFNGDPTLEMTTEILDDKGELKLDDFIYRERIKEINLIKEQIIYIDNEYENRLDALKNKSDLATYLGFSATITGAGSAVAAAILVAASPANAAVVAGLSAVSAGVTAFQQTASDVGLSYSLREELHETYKRDVGVAHKNLRETPIVSFQALARTASDDDWLGEITALGKAVVEYKTAVLYSDYVVDVKKNDRQTLIPES